MTISFDEACERLKENEHFFMVFNSLDDEADTYATILEGNSWFTSEFITPDEGSRHLILIKKSDKSKYLLVDYPRELGNRGFLDFYKWDDLVAVSFVRGSPLIEITVKDNKRREWVNFFKRYPQKILQELDH